MSRQVRMHLKLKDDKFNFQLNFGLDLAPLKSNSKNFWVAKFKDTGTFWIKPWQMAEVWADFTDILNKNLSHIKIHEKTSQSVWENCLMFIEISPTRKRKFHNVYTLLKLSVYLLILFFGGIFLITPFMFNIRSNCQMSIHVINKRCSWNTYAPLPLRPLKWKWMEIAKNPTWPRYSS